MYGLNKFPSEQLTTCRSGDNSAYGGGKNYVIMLVSENRGDQKGMFSTNETFTVSSLSNSNRLQPLAYVFTLTHMLIHHPIIYFVFDMNIVIYISL